QRPLCRLAALERLLVGRPRMLRRLELLRQTRRGFGRLLGRAGEPLLVGRQGLDRAFSPRQLFGPVMPDLLEGGAELLPAQRTVSLTRKARRPLDLLAGTSELVGCRLQLSLDLGEL